MVVKRTPDEQAASCGADLPVQVSVPDAPTMLLHAQFGDTLAYRFFPYAALDPGTLAALALVTARAFGALQC